MTLSGSSNHRHSIRLPGYDYSQAGAYFITIVTHGRRSLFGEIVNGEMMLNDAGKMIERVCIEIPQIITTMAFEIFQIMPNHFHGLIMIDNSIVGATLCGCPSQPVQTRRSAPTPSMGSLPNIVQRFKSIATTRYIAGVRQNGWQGFNRHLWQRNYYEHVIRDENDYQAIHDYILSNPLNWEKDEEYQG